MNKNIFLSIALVAAVDFFLFAQDNIYPVPVHKGVTVIKGGMIHIGNGTVITNGTILIDENPDLPKVGVWIMPDNINPGEIEDFFLRLIESQDFLFQRAQKVVGELIVEKPELIKETNRSKTETHTWLAWQEEPGRSMGVALKNNWAPAKHPLAARLAAWFAATFELAP